MEITAIVLSSCTALAALLSPILVLLINNKNFEKTKNFELLYVEKYEAYKTLFTNYGAWHAVVSYDNFAKFSSSVATAMLLSSKNARQELQALLSYCDENTADFQSNINDQFNICVNLLCSELNKHN